MAIFKVNINGHETYLKGREYLWFIGIRAVICIVILALIGIL